jgi:hypothetical protein
LTPEEEKRINDRFERIETDLETVAGFVLEHEYWAKEQRRLSAELTQKMTDLAEVQKDTGERLNILIGIVERYFSNGEKK